MKFKSFHEISKPSSRDIDPISSVFRLFTPDFTMSAAAAFFKRVEYSHKQPPHLVAHELKELSASLGEHDILVKVHAAALNPVDIVLKNSHWLLFWSRSNKGIGRDFAGEVVATGAKIDKFVKGDVISGIFHDIYTSQGSLSQYLKIDTQKSLNIGKFPLKNSPSDEEGLLTYEEAASFNLVFGTAFTTLTHFKKPDATTRVLIIGGGTSVAWYTIQLLKKVHNVEFVASINSPSSAERVNVAGADEIIDYTKGHVSVQVLELVKKTGKQFDLVIDTVGNNELFPVLEHILKPKSENSGYVTIVGDNVYDYKTSFGPGKFSFIFKLLWKRPYNYSFSSITAGWYDYAIDLFQQGKLKTNVSSVYPLEDFGKAITALEDHRATGKIVVTTD